MKTYQASPATIDQKWHLVDATDATLGRLAAKIAPILMGKTKPTYTPHVDTGDFVVVINAEKVAIGGNKAETKVYRHHTGWVGGLKEIPYARMMERHPERIIEAAVRRMMPKSKLGRRMFQKLKVYAGTDHPHVAQGPQALEI